MALDKLTFSDSEDPDNKFVVPLQDANYISLVCPCCGGILTLTLVGHQSHPPQVIDGEFVP